MRKFDPLQWNEVPSNVETQAPEGRLRLRLSDAAPVYITAHGVEVLAGSAKEVDAKTSAEMTFRVEGDVRVFLFAPMRQVFEPQGEVFTNADRAPLESGTVAAVTQAMRLLKLEHRAMMRDIQTERAALDAERSLRLDKVEAELGPEPETQPPVVVAEPDAEAEVPEPVVSRRKAK